MKDQRPANSNNSPVLTSKVFILILASCCLVLGYAAGKSSEGKSTATTDGLFSSFQVISSANAQSNSKKKSAREKVIGVIPRENGEPISLSGTPKSSTPIFVKENGDITLGDYRGGKLSKRAISVKRGDEKGKKKLILSTAGQVPDSYGKLVSVAGGPKNYILAFAKEDGEINVFEMRNGKLLNSALTIQRKDFPAKKKPRIVNIGQVPSSFGPALAVTGLPRNLSFAFSNEEGEVLMLDYKGGKLANIVQKIVREYR